MKQYTLSAGNLDKFLYQNRAEVIDCIEGCLLDNLLCYTKHGGIMAIYERYINCWTSGYYIEFTKDKSEADMIYRDFDILRRNAEMAI